MRRRAADTFGMNHRLPLGKAQNAKPRRHTLVHECPGPLRLLALRCAMSECCHQMSRLLVRLSGDNTNKKERGKDSVDNGEAGRGLLDTTGPRRRPGPMSLKHHPPVSTRPKHHGPLVQALSPPALLPAEAAGSVLPSFHPPAEQDKHKNPPMRGFPSDGETVLNAVYVLFRGMQGIPQSLQHVGATTGKHWVGCKQASVCFSFGLSWSGLSHRCARGSGLLSRTVCALYSDTPTAPHPRK